MVQIDGNTLLLHNGHDNENEKINDLWKFDLTSMTWTQLDQHGEVPLGRNGHSLMKQGNFIIMYGGIIEITKESEDIYVYHIPTGIWKYIDMSLGPINLDKFFATAKPGLSY